MNGDVDRIQFGDFQTPPALARRVVHLLRSGGLAPRTIVEPTCGTGAFVEAASTAFPDSAILAYDINPDHVRNATSLVRRSESRARRICEVANFFELDWEAILAPLAGPILVLGNPPWATSSGLGAIGGSNLPRKANFQNRRGLDARTGKSNFDVAESILLTLLRANRHEAITLAMLVKTSVARRVLAHLWTAGTPMETAVMYLFDVATYFGVSTDACLFVCRSGIGAAFECVVSDLERPNISIGRIGWRDGTLVSHPAAYDRQRSLVSRQAPDVPFRWRSGVKHDCSAIMELRPTENGTFVNRCGDRVNLEPDYLYPLLKGTDLLHGRVDRVHRCLIVTQTRPGEDTSVIARRAPDTWAYLCAHGERLDARRSSIYRNRPRFSVFGVGPYTFALWKVAISALHKRLSFLAVGPVHGRAVVFDDTCYHLSCDSESDARFVALLLNAECCRELLSAMVFWDAKRPITSDVLQRIDLRQVAIELGLSAEWAASSLASPGKPAVR
jgi:hypothetical protein